METLLQFVNNHIDQAPWIIFFLILLAGLNIPISEDIMLISGGAIASIYPEQSTFKIYIIIFMACWLAAWECYWIGRLLGPKLYDVRIFKRFITPEKVERLHEYYERFGVFTFIVGRFIPGGVRNCLFLSAGLGKMPFLKFILRDGVGALISTAVIFSLGYWLGDNYKMVVDAFMRYNLIIITVVLLVIFLIFSYVNREKKGEE